MAQRLAHGGHDAVALHGVRVDHRRAGPQLQRLSRLQHDAVARAAARLLQPPRLLTLNGLAE
eukprot:2109081-Rhodomonas_salina.1